MFVTAVTGNYASYVSYQHTHAGDAASSGEAQAWYYDIDKVCRNPEPCPCDTQRGPHRCVRRPSNRMCLGRSQGRPRPERRAETVWGLRQSSMHTVLGLLPVMSLVVCLPCGGRV